MKCDLAILTSDQGSHLKILSCIQMIGRVSKRGCFSYIMLGIEPNYYVFGYLNMPISATELSHMLTKLHISKDSGRNAHVCIK